jgi:hypothetical protein
MDLQPQIQFGGLSIDAITDAHSKVASGNAAYFKPKVGNSYIIRLLPGAPGQSALVTVFQHFFDKFMGGKKPLSFNCPRKAATGECPSCSRADALRGSDNPQDVAAARDYDPRPRCFGVIIDRGAPALGPQVWAFPKGVMDELHSLRTDVKKYGQDFTNPFNGDDLYLEVKAGRFTDYKIGIAHQGQKRLAQTDEQMLAWLNSAPKLDLLTKTEPTMVIVRQIFVATKEAEGFALDQANALADQTFGAATPRVALGPVGGGMVPTVGVGVPNQYMAPQVQAQAFQAPDPQLQAQQYAASQYAAQQQQAQLAAQQQQQAQYLAQQQAYAQQQQQVQYQQQVAQQPAVQYQYPPQQQVQAVPQQYMPQPQVPVQPAAVPGTYQMPSGQPMNNLAQQIAQNPSAVQHNF